jgi:hypothetical protein
VLLYFSYCSNAQGRCRNTTDSSTEKKIAAEVDNELHDVQDFLFTRNSTVCDVSKNRYTASYCVVFAAFVVLGFVFTFFGYRLFKLILFLTGFIAVFLFVFYISYNNIPCSWNLKYINYISFGIAAAAGLIVGIVAVCLFYFGIAVIGFALGVVAGLSLLPFIHISYVEDHSWLPIVIVVVLGVIGAIIALMIQKPLIILSTSLLGGYLIVMGLDYFVENMQAFIYAWNLMDHRVKANFPHCAATWVMLSLVPVLVIIGIIVQGKCTGKGDHHKRQKKQARVQMDQEPLII